MSDPDTYDPNSYSDIRPGTHPELFDGPHNAPRSQPWTPPQWWVWLMTCVVGAIVITLVGFIVFCYCLWRRSKQQKKRGRGRGRGRGRIDEPVELQPIPKVQFPFYFPPAAVGRGMPCLPNRETVDSADEHAVPFDELHPHLQQRVTRDSQSENQFNPAFDAHRQQQLNENDGAFTDVVLRTDTSTMGPSTVAGVPTIGAPHQPTKSGLAGSLIARQHPSERDAAAHDVGLQVPAQPQPHYQRVYMPEARLPRPTDYSTAAESAFSAAQFPSAESEMTGYGETELTHDPWRREAERNKRMV